MESRKGAVLMPFQPKHTTTEDQRRGENLQQKKWRGKRKRKPTNKPYYYRLLTLPNGGKGRLRASSLACFRCEETLPEEILCKEDPAKPVEKVWPNEPVGTAFFRKLPPRQWLFIVPYCSPKSCSGFSVLPVALGKSYL